MLQVLRVATGLLGKFIGMREPNLKYLGLESLMRLVDVPAVAETINKCALATTAAVAAAIAATTPTAPASFSSADRSPNYIQTRAHTHARVHPRVQIGVTYAISCEHHVMNKGLNSAPERIDQEFSLTNM